MHTMLWLAQRFQDDFDGFAQPSPFASLISLVLTILVIAGLWRLFEKAGKPGWAAIIPIYNTIVLLEIVGRPWWWILLLLIPFLNLVIILMVMIDLAKSFGQGTGFGCLLVLFSFVMIPILGFGDAQYLGPAAGDMAMDKPKNY